VDLDTTSVRWLLLQCPPDGTVSAPPCFAEHNVTVFDESPGLRTAA
jgi:hypothetical protein